MRLNKVRLTLCKLMILTHDFSFFNVFQSDRMCFNGPTPIQKWQLSSYPQPLTEILRSLEDIISGSNEFNVVSIHSPQFSTADLSLLNIMPVHPLPLLCLRSRCCLSSFLK